MSLLEINHQNHALGDEMHIFTLVWYLKDQYNRINIHVNYRLMENSRGKEYTNYIKPFITKLYSVIDNVLIIENSSKGFSKERLGRLIKSCNVELPNLFEIGVVPKVSISNVPSDGFILVSTRIRYPPHRINWDTFVNHLCELSKTKTIVLIGEKQLDRENNEIFTIYTKIKNAFETFHCSYVDLTADTNLYRGESQLDHLWRDLNIVKNSSCVITVGISGFIDICSLITKVYTIGSFNRSYTRLIWNNTKHKGLIKCKNLDDLFHQATDNPPLVL